MADDRVDIFTVKPIGHIECRHDGEASMVAAVLRDNDVPARSDGLTFDFEPRNEWSVKQYCVVTFASLCIRTTSDHIVIRRGEHVSMY